MLDRSIGAEVSVQNLEAMLAHVRGREEPQRVACWGKGRRNV